jgi:hypothetical protein
MYEANSLNLIHIRLHLDQIHGHGKYVHPARPRTKTHCNSSTLGTSTSKESAHAWGKLDWLDTYLITIAGTSTAYWSTQVSQLIDRSKEDNSVLLFCLSASLEREGYLKTLYTYLTDIYTPPPAHFKFVSFMLPTRYVPRR